MVVLMPNFRAVLFDVDNTLLDFMAMKTTCCEAAVKTMIDYGLPVQKDEALRTLYALFDELGWENRQIFDRFLERVHGRVEERIIANGIVAYRDTQRSLLKPYASVIPTLMAIRESGVATGVISDAPNRNGWIRLVETGLQHFFDAAVYIGDTGEAKPSSKPFAHALAALKRVRPELTDLLPSQCLMVGDVPARDILGAQQFGMKACFAAYGNTRGEQAPTADYTIQRFEELKAIVLAQRANAERST